MITRKLGTKNGYCLTINTTTADIKEASMAYKRLSCIVCNAKTSKRFRRSIFGNSLPITINNKVEDEVIYFNAVI